jgi:hypothetical protein
MITTRPYGLSDHMLDTLQAEAQAASHSHELQVRCKLTLQHVG